MHFYFVTERPEVTEQLKLAYTRAGRRRKTKLKWIGYRFMNKSWWQSKYTFTDVGARELVDAMLYTDAKGHLYRERGGGFGPRKHLVRVWWKDLEPYEKKQLRAIFAKQLQS